MRSALLHQQRRRFDEPRQNDVSRSLHELADVDRFPSSSRTETRNFVPRAATRRLTSEIDVSCLRQANFNSFPTKSTTASYEDRPVLRRKRYTRRQRKSATICPETGLILAAGSQFSSSSDEDEKKVPSPRPKPRGLSASTFELSLPAETQEEPTKKQHRGPAARRAGRRNAKLQQQTLCAASANNLDRIDESPLNSEKRSLSVRDLQGEECDFTNQDSVTKWTSQILAELDSLPSSCMDLATKTSKREEEKASPPVPPHRMTQSSFFPSWEQQQEEWRMTASMSQWTTNATWMTPEENHVNDVMSQSMNSVGTREREDSLVASTLVGSSTDSDAGTPVAGSPAPLEDVPILTSGKSTSIENGSSLERRSIGVQGPETPLYAQRGPSDEDQGSSLKLVMTEGDKVNLVAPPKPAIRTILNTKETTTTATTTRSFVETSTSSKLLSNIARLSKSMFLTEEDIHAADRSSKSSIPSIRTSLWSCADEELTKEDQLSQWKKKAECRARSNAPPDAKSVDRVVASMIKSIEDSRLTAIDRPSNLLLEPKPQDVSTQTSPFSLSRSSSFDWVHDATEGALRELKTPLSTPRSELPGPLSSRIISSSSETDEADREVAEMTRGVVEDRRRESMQRRESAEKKNSKMFPDLEESIAMLLQVGNEEKPPVRSLPKSKLCTVPPNLATPPEIRRPIPQFPLSMSESIYDNMGASERRRRSEEPDLPKPTASQLIIEDLLGGKVIPTLNNNTKYQSKNSLMPLTINQRAGSCEILNDAPKSPSSAGSSASSLKERLLKAEEEAHECCQWLRKAGFPQYAKQYEESEFPIDLRSVRSDHEFLEADSLRALFRRLDALNRCAIMRIDNVVLRRRNEDYNYDMYSFDDEDNVALSGNWKYQRNSHTWSRVGNEPMYGAPGRLVSTVTNYNGGGVYKDPYAVKDTRHSPYEERGTERRLERYDLRPEDANNSKLQRSQSERIKDTAKALMKKMNPRSGSRRRRESRPRDASAMLISEPVLVSYDSASPEAMRMLRPTHISESRPRQSRSKSARRQGVVLLSPSSPESSSTDDSFRFRHRERSVPPQRLVEREPVAYYEPQQLIHQRLRRERTAMDEYLYGNMHNSLNRAKQRTQPPPPRYYDNVYTYVGGGSSGQSSPAYSSPYSNRSFPTPPVRSRQLNVMPDGYYMHGQFDDSPDASLARRTRQFEGSPSTSGVVPQLRVDTLRAKSQSSLDNTDEEQCSSTAASSQNRRDSGVGSSLSRSPSGPSAQRIRQSMLPYYSLSVSVASSNNSTSSNGSWNNGTKRRPVAERLMTSSLTSCSSTDEMFFNDEELLKCMDALSAVEMARIRKLAYLRITAIMEKHMGAAGIKLDPMTSSSGTSAANKNWTVQKLFRRIKHSDGKIVKENEESTVFGQTLDSIYRRTGHCLPRTILEVLRYLRSMAPDTVGIFRKNGVKSRISELRQHCDRDADADVFVDTNRLDAGQVHDVADMLKQYLRELPDRLMTSRLSEVFAGIFLHVPETERTSALKFALLLLPDENREALQTLLFFLADIAKYSEVNNMGATNLAVCFTPSLFHLSASRLDKISGSNRRHKTIGASGMPTEKEMQETRAAQLCLTHLITNCRAVFLAPEMNQMERIDFEDDLPLLKELGPGGPRNYLIEKVADMLRENNDRWKSWIVEGTIEGVEISARKPSDAHPLRPFRVWVDVAAPPKEVLHRIMKERPVWDHAVLNWRSIDMQLAPDTDLHQFVLNDTIGHATRDCYVVRYHRVDMPELRGACAVAERSVQCGETQLLGGLPAAILDNRFLIEPKSGYSRVTCISRIDLRGRSSTWYNRIYGSVLARQMARLRDSFKKADDFGPETKV